MRKKLIVLTTILGLIAFSGVAAAEEHESENTEETGDTIFNFGYDDVNGVFIWGSAASDGDVDCTLENGSLQPTYADDGEGGLLVEDLAHLDGEESLEFDPEGGDCQLSAGEVAGPQGQVNHGMFLKLFNSMFDGQARGCMVRHIAQSGLGTGDQQVNVPDVEDTEENGEFEESSIDFETVMTDCVHGPDDEAEIEGQGRGAEMRPAWVSEKLADKQGEGDVEELGSGDDDSGRQGPPDHARGKGPNG